MIYDKGNWWCLFCKSLFLLIAKYVFDTVGIFWRNLALDLKQADVLMIKDQTKLQSYGILALLQRFKFSKNILATGLTTSRESDLPRSEEIGFNLHLECNRYLLKFFFTEGRYKKYAVQCNAAKCTSQSYVK